MERSPQALVSPSAKWLRAEFTNLQAGAGLGEEREALTMGAKLKVGGAKISATGKHILMQRKPQ